jgi:hypothetical protein
MTNRVNEQMPLNRIGSTGTSRFSLSFSPNTGRNGSLVYRIYRVCHWFLHSFKCFYLIAERPITFEGEFRPTLWPAVNQSIESIMPHQRFLSIRFVSHFSVHPLTCSISIIHRRRTRPAIIFTEARIQFIREDFDN